MRLDRVMLFQSGLGHFEWRGRVTGSHLILRVRPDEVDDVIKTLVVTDTTGTPQQVAAVLPGLSADATGSVEIDVGLAHPDLDLVVTYATPTAAWKTTYRVALDDAGAQLQAWAMLDNVSEQDWDDVRLSLATGAPLSYRTDLRTPLHIERPDATGQLVLPYATAALGAERGALLGGTTVDRDADGILDVADRCPDDDETTNGRDDDDGCPDTGRVIVTESVLAILDKIHFAPGSDRPTDLSQPVLDAVAATLRGTPDITLLEIQGHADGGERDAWALGERRAAEVRARLLAAGVTTALTTRSYGPSSPISERAADNRRVEFVILRRDADAPAAPVDAAARSSQAFTAAAATARVEVAGSARHDLVDRVSVPRGTSALVAMLSEAVAGEELLLFRPEPGMPGSDLHPLRAARLALPAGLGVEPGPVAIYAGGGFAGEAIMPRTPGGEALYLPFALDGGTRVRLAVEQRARPARLVAISRGVATIEDADVRTTIITVEAGASAPARLMVRLEPTPGMTMGELPPGSERGDAAVLVAVPLRPGQPSTVTVEERRPLQRTIEVLGPGGATLAAYLDGSHLPPTVEAGITAVVAARRDLATADAERDAVRLRLRDVQDRAVDLERSLEAVRRLPGSDAAALRRALVAQLTSNAADAARATAALGDAAARAEAARLAVQMALERLTLAPAA